MILDVNIILKKSRFNNCFFYAFNKLIKALAAYSRSKEVAFKLLGSTFEVLKKHTSERGKSLSHKAHKVMSLGDIFKKFFGEADECKREKEEDEIIKSLSLAACENKHKILMKCCKTSWIGGCKTEMDSFWKCVNDQKAILRKKAKAYRKKQNIEKMETSEEINDSGG